MSEQTQPARLRPSPRGTASGLSLRHFLRTAPFEPGEDRDQAPAAYDGPDARPRWSWARARQNMIWVYGFGLVFLAFAVVGLTTEPLSTAQRLLGFAMIAVLGAMYLAAAWMADTSLWTRWAYLAAFLAVLGGTAVVWGWEFFNYGVYVSVLLATLIPWRHARLALVVWNVLLVAVTVFTGEWTPLLIAAVGLSVGLATGGGIESGRVSRRLARAEQRISVLALAAERERIGRDLHDILGHSLTVISIKTQLAGRLVDQDPTAAKAQLVEVEEVARQALADVRATASGFRQTRVASEIASARSVLTSAGVAAQVPTAVEALPDEVSELFGYVVREAVTNIVRHSEATTCRITVDARHVEVSDDGRGFGGGGSCSGNGLTGLAARVQGSGGSLEVLSRPGGGTTVRAWRSAPVPAVGEPVRDPARS